MVKLDSTIDRELKRFFHWWGGELASLLPERLREFFSRSRPKLILAKNGDGAALTLANHGEIRSLGVFPLDYVVKEGESLFKEHPDLAGAERVLLLPSGQYLQQTIKLPAAAEENLNQVVAFELDRWTPFKADQVYFGTRIVERLPDTRQIKLELALTPREKLDPVLGELADAGWRPERVDVGPEPDGHGMDLLPERFRPHRSRLPQAVTGFTAAVLLVVAALVLTLPIYANRSLAQELQQEVKKASKTAQEVEALKTQVEQRQNEQGFLSRKKLTEPTMLDMLNDLTKVMPDDTWLNGLQYRDRKVTIQGQSPAASSLIERIEASDFFKNTSFVSPVTKDVASGQERFQITSEVTNGGLSEKPSE
jgi:general secretion pathway protein L